ncbi:effector-associated constant component EACC1 [Actinomadura meridiana]|uniref:effector-associated constant component EACC1 n=1 Tax=Actinomadura meridiana TaxID=559626 RepID=UPI0031EF1FCA
MNTVQIKIDGGDEVGGLVALHDWLRGEAELAGFVKLGRRAAGAEELGGVLDVVTVAVGSGGVAAVLAQSLPTWIRSRRPAVKVTITSPNGRTLELEAAEAADAERLIMDLLRQVDDGA